jgi:hypothetical protein
MGAETRPYRPVPKQAAKIEGGRRGLVDRKSLPSDAVVDDENRIRGGAEKNALDDESMKKRRCPGKLQLP